MKTILITGGAGFLGSHLCKKLLDEGNKVICVDNLYTGSKGNIENFFDNDNFSFIDHNIIEPLSINEGIDEIYNLACPASPIHYQKDPVFTLLTSVLGMKNVLDLAEEKGAKILQASTSEVYGDPEVHPQGEGYNGNVNPIGPRSCYDEGKRAAESLCFDYKREKGVDVKVVRIFNTYGPYMDKKDGRVVSNFITQALDNEPITVYGEGDQTRSFCYVDDLLNGFVKMMGSSESGPINLGNPGEFTILELAEKVIDLTDSKSKIIHKELPKDDPTKRRPNIEKAKTLLNWQPIIDLEEGLKRTIEYFRGSNE